MCGGEKTREKRRRRNIWMKKIKRKRKNKIRNKKSKLRNATTIFTILSQ